MARIGYLRPARAEDGGESRIAEIRSQVEAVFSDEAPDRDYRRPGFVGMMASLKSGDVLYVESLSGLAGSVRDLIQTFDAIMAKGAHLISLKEGIDTSADSGKQAIAIFSALSDMDKSFIRDWEQDRIEAARKASKAHPFRNKR